MDQPERQKGLLHKCQTLNKNANKTLLVVMSMLQMTLFNSLMHRHDGSAGRYLPNMPICIANMSTCNVKYLTCYCNNLFHCYYWVSVRPFGKGTKLDKEMEKRYKLRGIFLSSGPAGLAGVSGPTPFLLNGCQIKIPLIYICEEVWWYRGVCLILKSCLLDVLKFRRPMGLSQMSLKHLLLRSYLTWRWFEGAIIITDFITSSSAIVKFGDSCYRI